MFLKRKNFWVIFFILILLILSVNLDYPKYWNKGADRLSKFHIPHFWERPFRLGLDLQGGTQLTYEADLSSVEQKHKSDAMDGVRDVIERRVNAFGVSEPLIQVTQAGNKYRLLVELAGVKDVDQAIKLIGETPSLDFREARTPEDTLAVLEKYLGKDQAAKIKDTVCSSQVFYKFLEQSIDPCYKLTGLSGKQLTRAQVSFGHLGAEPIVNLEFNNDGAKLFEEITTRNVGKPVAIYLDGAPISIPRVNEPITGGKAQISGRFTTQEAKDLARRLNAGALPVPIHLLSQRTIGASLGEEALKQSLKAGSYAFILIAFFMILIYWLQGFMALLALLLYVAVLLAIFKLIPVTLTLAGIAGFIMSIGIAVDANILIFERMKEERRLNKSLSTVLEEGFKRAWPSIRDSNFSTLLTCFILYWFGTSVISGFALTLAIGILVSMFSAIFVTKSLLKLTYK